MFCSAALFFLRFSAEDPPWCQRGKTHRKFSCALGRLQQRAEQAVKLQVSFVLAYCESILNDDGYEQTVLGCSPCLAVALSAGRSQEASAARFLENPSLPFVFFLLVVLSRAT